MDVLESKKEKVRLKRISFFEIALIAILIIPIISCWWQIVKWLNGQEVPFMNGGALVGFLLALSITLPPIFIIIKEIRRYKKYKQTKINTN